jgi:hypothetical protein
MTAKSSTTGAKRIARQVDVITFQTESRQGKLTELLRMLADHKVNLLGFCAYDEGPIGTLMLIPDKPAKAIETLEKAGFGNLRRGKMAYAVAPDEVGAAARLSGKIAESGINITYSFATCCGGSMFGVVFQTEDNRAAVRALNS